MNRSSLLNAQGGTHHHRIRSWIGGSPLHVLLILSAVSLVYAGTVHAPFQWDEKVWLVNNPFVENIRAPIDTLQTTDPELYKHLRNRTVGFLTFALNYRLHGYRAEGYHLVNMVLHGANALLVYFLIMMTIGLRRFAGTALQIHAPTAGLLAALLFAVHPLNTEAVNYVFQRFTVLATFFSLLAVLLYTASRRSTALQGRTSATVLLYCGAVLCAVLAMRTKEIAFTLPFLITLYELSFFDGPLRPRMLRLVPVQLTALIIPVTYLVGMDMSLDQATRGMGIDVSRLSYLFTELRVVATYLRLLLFPVGQNLDHDYPLSSSFLEVGVFMSFVLLAVMIASAFFLYRKSRSGEPGLRLAAYGILWFFIALSVESSVLPQPNVINEYRLYLPSVGIFLSAAVAILLLRERLSNRTMRRILMACCGAAIALYGYAAYERSLLWRDGIALWKDTVTKNPKRSRAHNNLGVAYLGGEMPDEAMQEFRTAIRLHPGNLDAYRNLAQVYRELGCWDELRDLHSAARRIEPGFSLGQEAGNGADADGPVRAHRTGNDRCRQQDAQVRADKERLTAAADADPKDAAARFDLGNLYLQQGRLEEAAASFKDALRIRPDYIEARNNLAGTYLQMGRFAEARQELEAMLKQDPELEAARENLQFVNEMIKRRGKRY
jgi:tetratricopeptide (TPR) repeat protein